MQPPVSGSSSAHSAQSSSEAAASLSRTLEPLIPESSVPREPELAHQYAYRLERRYLQDAQAFMAIDEYLRTAESVLVERFSTGQPAGLVDVAVALGAVQLARRRGPTDDHRP